MSLRWLGDPLSPLPEQDAGNSLLKNESQEEKKPLIYCIPAAWDLVKDILSFGGFESGNIPKHLMIGHLI